MANYEIWDEAFKKYLVSNSLFPFDGPLQSFARDTNSQLKEILDIDNREHEWIAESLNNAYLRITHFIDYQRKKHNFIQNTNDNSFFQEIREYIEQHSVLGYESLRKEYKLDCKIDDLLMEMQCEKNVEYENDLNKHNGEVVNNVDKNGSSSPFQDNASNISHVGFLRKIFSRILAKKDELPTLKKLLMTFQDEQPKLKELEEKMNAYSVYFPVDKPLALISKCLSRDLTRATFNSVIEQSFHTSFNCIFSGLNDALRDVLLRYGALDNETKKKVEQLFNGAVKKVETVIRNERSLPLPPITTPKEARLDKGELGSALWGILVTEVACRKELHAATLSFIEDISNIETDLEHYLNNVYEECKKEVDRHVEPMLAQVSTLVEDVEEGLKALDDMEKAVQRKYTLNYAILDEDIKSQEYKMISSQKRQETILRRIRELYKELSKEQKRESEGLYSVLAIKIKIITEDVGMKQFRRLVDNRRIFLTRARETPAKSSEIVNIASEICRNMLSAIERHVKRTICNETTRKYCATKIAIDNAFQWRRAVGDVLVLLEDQYDNWKENKSLTWQINLLRATELSPLTQELLQFKQEMEDMVKSWETLEKKYVIPLGFSVPFFSERIDANPTIQYMREIFINMDQNRWSLKLRKAKPISWEEMKSSSSLLKELLPRTYGENIKWITNKETGNNINGLMKERQLQSASIIEGHKMPWLRELRNKAIVTSKIIAPAAIVKFEDEMDKLYEINKERQRLRFSEFSAVLEVDKNRSDLHIADPAAAIITPKSPSRTLL